ncbi:MAG: hypothetical protein ACIAQZ_13475 [Sedimentisphaeraceae bacterium JB056]
MKEQIIKLTICLVLIFTASSFADSFFEDFESTPNGSMPAGWNVYDYDSGDASVVFGVTDSFASTNVATSKRAMVTTSDSPYDLCYYNGNSADGVPATSWKNYSVSAVINYDGSYWSSTQDWCGLVGRLQPSTGNAIGCRFKGKGDGSEELFIYTLINNNGSFQQIRLGTLVTDFDDKQDWIITLNVFDNDDISATQVWATAVPVDESQDPLLVSCAIAYDDTRFAAAGLTNGGCAGAIFYHGSTRKMNFDDFTVNFEKPEIMPRLVGHFQSDTSSYLGHAYWSIADPTNMYSWYTEIDSQDYVTSVADGVFNKALNVCSEFTDPNTTGALFEGSDEHYDDYENGVRTTAFWWKPNFAKPTVTSSVEIWSWDTYVVTYNYDASTGKDYLTFTIPTSSGDETVSTVAAVDAVDFADYNFVASSWFNNRASYSASADAIGIKLNDAAQVVETLTGQIVDETNRFFGIYNGIFDEMVIMPIFMDDNDLEQARTRTTEFAPDSTPIDCADAIDVYGPMPYDLDGNCYIGTGDLTIMASQWLNCINPGDSNCDTPWL